jgi:hypothetical protein
MHLLHMLHLRVRNTPLGAAKYGSAWSCLAHPHLLPRFLLSLLEADILLHTPGL